MAKVDQKVETVEQTPDEQIQAVSVLREKLENNFTELGQLLSQIKRTKIFKFKGYRTFKEFVEAELQMASAMANKIVRIYEYYLKELDQDETTMHEIGLDRLNIITPVMKGSSFEEMEEWIKKAQELTVSELRDEVKEVRSKKKEKERTLKDIFVDQYFEKMVTYLNCSRKELNFKLACYFQDMDLSVAHKIIKTNQRKFEED